MLSEGCWIWLSDQIWIRIRLTRNEFNLDPSKIPKPVGSGSATVHIGYTLHSTCLLALQILPKISSKNKPLNVSDVNCQNISFFKSSAMFSLNQENDVKINVSMKEEFGFIIAFSHHIYFPWCLY